MNERTQIQTKTETPSFSPLPSLTGGTSLLQRKCACGGTPGVDGECAECRKTRLQRRASNHAKPETAPPIVHETLSSPGQPLDRPMQAAMEQRLGHDFSRVSVHTKSTPKIQPKLMVNASRGLHEQEADTIAHQLVQRGSAQVAKAFTPADESRGVVEKLPPEPLVQSYIYRSRGRGAPLLPD